MLTLDYLCLHQGVYQNRPQNSKLIQFITVVLSDHDTPSFVNAEIYGLEQWETETTTHRFQVFQITSRNNRRQPGGRSVNYNMDIFF